MLKGIRLVSYSEDEIRKLCVAEVKNASTYDRGIPRLYGVNDPRLGLTHQTAKCPTCAKINCDQHMGYIQLAKPVYKIGMINYALQVLRCVCRNCAKPKFWSEGSPHDPNGRADITSILRDGYTAKERLRVVSEMSRTKYQCASCNISQPNYIKRDRTFIEANYRARDLIPIDVPTRFMPDEARGILEALDEYTKNTLELVRPEEMVIRLHIVPPPSIRPSNFVGETKVRSENDLTLAIQDMVRANIELQASVESGVTSDIFFSWDKLQIMASGIVQFTIKKVIGVKLGLLPLLTATAKHKKIDIKTRLSGKKGRFRGNLAGKRVDQSGRSVIAPDSSHDIMQLGVPSTIMNTLTFPETVNNLNRTRLAQAIILGAYTDGGAMTVRQPGASPDTLIWLPVLDKESRIELAAQIEPLWTVERHLVDGDWVLFNRQPSLWKASMMAFQAYRVDTLCFRLPLPVTKPFNADFDGDEMNIHSLQSYAALAEAQELLSVPKQMLTPQSNTVIIGLVQDSLVGGYRVSDKDTFFTPDQFTKLLSCQHYNTSSQDYSDIPKYNSEFSDVIMVPKPAILKAPGAPKGLYTGKQLVSSMLPHDVHLSKFVRKSNQFEFHNDNDCIVIRNGIHLSGQLCKATLGATNHGLVQIIAKKYGCWAACKFVSDAQRIFVTALTYIGPSISILDCCAESPDTNTTMTTLLSKARSLLQLELPPEIIEAKSSEILQSTLRVIGADVVDRLDPKSGLFTVVTAGSKGNLMNIAQIAGTVGQQTVFGRRVGVRRGPVGLRTLACFEPNDVGPESRGFIKNSYMRGLRPHEFFYHQMSGREGIVATAVNTADSGYNQRRMIKSQESQCVSYDGSVRVASTLMVTLAYGFDDMDGSMVSRFRLPNSLLKRYNNVTADRCVSLIQHVLSQRASLFRELDMTVVCPISLDYFEHDVVTEFQSSEKSLERLLLALLDLHKTMHLASRWYIPLPAAVTILLCASSDAYNDSRFEEIVSNYQKALVHTGEGVGTLAATCIGEPSMQMTLNVFHYSGIASKNVTITGLPRFRQIINAIDTYETANMNAELVSFEDSKYVSSVFAVKVSTVATISVVPIAELDPFVAMLSKTMPLNSGYLSQKVYKRKTLTGVQAKWFIRLDLDYTACERFFVRAEQVSDAIMHVLGCEVSVVGNVHELMQPIYVFPYVCNSEKEYVEAFSQSLYEIFIHGIDGVKRAIPQQETRWTSQLVPRSVHTIDTEGSSFIEFGKLSFIRQETAVTNNIVEITNVLGINAGVSVLQAELHKVLSFDSSYIDPRHTWLLADTMCRAGSICAMTRHNMEHLGNSILQRASFEQSLETLNEAAVFGRTDQLKGATERIMVGQCANVGTGIVDLISDVKVSEMPQVLVGPMSLDEKESSTEHSEKSIVVAPLKQTKTFNIKNFAVRIQDEAKDFVDPELDAAIGVWRSVAANTRIIAQLQVRQEVSVSEHRGLLAECRSFTWTQTVGPIQKTIVDYSVGTEQQQFTIVGKDFECRHVIRKILHENTSSSITVFHDSPNVAVATSVVPRTVTIRLETLFIRNGFVFTLVKEWIGDTVIIAERAVVESRPRCFVEVTYHEPDVMLQARCSNAQIASAFRNRLA